MLKKLSALIICMSMIMNAAVCFAEDSETSIKDAINRRIESQKKDAQLEQMKMDTMQQLAGFFEIIGNMNAYYYKEPDWDAVLDYISDKLHATFSIDLEREEQIINQIKMKEDDDAIKNLSDEEKNLYRQWDSIMNLMVVVERLYEDIKLNDLVHQVCAACLEGFDDRGTYYYNPEEWKEMWEDSDEAAGLGLCMATDYENDRCVVTRAYGPAQEAGIHRGDILLSVNNQISVTAKTLREAMKVMRGAPGTSCLLSVLRNGEELQFEITREFVNMAFVDSQMLDNGIGLIKIYEFAGKVDDEFESEMNVLLAQGAKALIIDLRDNPGGWIDAGQFIADLFMDSGDYCYFVYRENAERHDYKTHDGKTDIPLAVLINEYSASGTEMFAAALRERAGAKLIGMKTSGIGTVQMVMDVSVGEEQAGFQATIAEVYTPKGNAIEGIGISPDVVVPLKEGDNGEYAFADLEKDYQLKTAFDVLSDQLD